MIYIVNNIREVFFSFFLEKDREERNCYILNKNLIGQEVVEKIAKYNDVFCLNLEKTPFKKGVMYFYRKKIFLPKILKKVRENKIVSFSDQDVVTRYFIEKKCDVFLCEHGLINYQFEFKSKIDKIKKYIFGMEKPYGRCEYVKKIYLTGLAPLPQDIAHKVEIIDLKKIWKTMKEKQQEEILDILSFDFDIRKKLKDRDMILFTQPLSENGIITESEKIEIYSKIIKKYPKDRLIIKTHPREKTDYKNIFQENLVLDNPFPFEILNLLEVKFNRAITLFSTAALSLEKEVKIDFYGTEIHPKILKKFGSCDYLMRRNCFLEDE